MTPTFLVAIILIAHVSAFDECTGATILSAPIKVYRSTQPFSATDSVRPAGSMHNDIWYRVDLSEPFSFTFYGEQSSWALYKSSSCERITTDSQVAGNGSSIPLILSTGTYFFRVGTLAPSPAVAPVYEYAFSVLNDYPVIGNVQTATKLVLEGGLMRKDIAVPKFHVLTADVDGRNLSQNILWDSSWYLISLPPMNNTSVTVFFHDLTAPGRDDYASIVMNFFTTPNQNSPSGPYTSHNTIFTTRMNLNTRSSFYLQIGRSSRCTYVTNYNLTVILEKNPYGPITTSPLTTASVPVPITSSSITSGSVPAPVPAIPTPAGIPAIPTPPEVTVVEFCTGKTWDNMDRFGLGYFCTQDVYYYRCDASGKLSAKIKCDETQRCRCTAGEECSQGGRRSPCK